MGKHWSKTIILRFKFFWGRHMQTVRITVTVTINPAPPPALVATPSTVTLPDAIVGSPVTAPVAVVSGGTPPYSTPVIDPTSPSPLPPGLTPAIDANGNVTLVGTPTTPGTGTFVLDVSDSGT
jgi:hypothetical protein